MMMSKKLCQWQLIFLMCCSWKLKKAVISTPEPEMIHNKKQSVAVQVIHEDSENGDSENADSENEEWMYPGQVNLEEHKREHNRQVAAELELINKLRSEKREKAMDHEAVAIMEKMEQMKKQ